jgi:hypothetical protein
MPLAILSPACLAKIKTEIYISNESAENTEFSFFSRQQNCREDDGQQWNMTQSAYPIHG